MYTRSLHRPIPLSRLSAMKRSIDMSVQRIYLTRWMEAHTFWALDSLLTSANFWLFFVGSLPSVLQVSFRDQCCDWTEHTVTILTRICHLILEHLDELVEEDCNQSADEWSQPWEPR